MIGVEKTLIIAYGDFGLKKFLEFKEQVFICFLPGSELQQYDERETERIRHFIENKECKQVVFVGTMDQTMINKMHQADSLSGLRAALYFNQHMSIADDNGKNIFSDAVWDQLMLERHVLTQCTRLMEYYFVRQRVERRELKVRGIVAALQEEQLKPIFCNGIKYNDIISMN